MTPLCLQNGDIFVRRISKLIDKEQNDNIILQVKAVDAGKPPSQVSIQASIIISFFYITFDISKCSHLVVTHQLHRSNV